MPRRIAIVDGVFYQSLAVSPNEILTAIAAGHRVYGAASMGALRAVELAPAGMIGVGRIFQAFGSGTTERDDEVAVVFDPETGRALTDALISMRIAFDTAAAAGVLTDEEALEATSTAERLHYSLRTYPRVLTDVGLPAGRRRKLLAFLLAHAADLKAEDARTLLRRLARAERCGEPIAPSAAVASPPFARLSARAGPVGAAPPLSEWGAVRKTSGWKSVRAVPAADTDALLATTIGRLGITRVAEITQLDTLGIPCYSAIWPGTGISAYSGKSLDRVEARVGAQMEAIEAVLSQDALGVQVRSGRFAEIAHADRALDPDRLPVFGSETGSLHDREFDWIEGWDVVSGETVWVPVDAIYLRATPPPPWHLSSNGLASGNCLAEALVHALNEVVERDALTLYTLATDFAHLPNLMAQLAGAPRVPEPDQPRAATGWYPFVDHDTLPAPLRDAVRQIRERGVSVGVRWIASDIPLPVFLCVIHEPGGPRLSLTHAGSGAHPDAAVAARRAITEAVQSRATFIHGVREDLRDPALRAQDPPPADWFAPETERIAFSTLPSHACDDIVADLLFIVRALSSAGLDDVFAVDLSHRDVPFTVVRVIVPRLEAPLDFRDRRRVALGPRARRVFAWSTR